MKNILLVVFLFASTSAYATTAIWTGNKEKLQTATGQTKWKCEYRVANTTLMLLLWREFIDSCPSEINIETE
jgi:hypothetical protein